MTRLGRLASTALLLSAAACTRKGAQCDEARSKNATSERGAVEAWVASRCGGGALAHPTNLRPDEVREQLAEDGRWYPFNAAMPPEGPRRYRDAEGREFVGYAEARAFGCGTEYGNVAFVRCNDGRVIVYRRMRRAIGTCVEPHDEDEPAEERRPCDPGTRWSIWRLPVEREDQVIEGIVEIPTIDVEPP